MIGARCLLVWAFGDARECRRMLYILTAPNVRLGSMASKKGHLSEPALGSHNAPMPSKLMTSVRFPSPPPICTCVNWIVMSRFRALLNVDRSNCRHSTPPIPRPAYSACDRNYPLLGLARRSSTTPRSCCRARRDTAPCGSRRGRPHVGARSSRRSPHSAH
jgi:hypothetical protein